MIRLQEGLRVLLIENIQKDKDQLFEMLRDAGIEIAGFNHVSSPQEAFTTIRVNKPDIIFFAPDAEPATKTLQELNTASTAPVILLSNKTENDFTAAMLPGADDVLYKNNLDAALLHRSIRYCLEGRKKDAELKEIIERFDLLAKATNDIVWDWELTKRRALWMGNGLQASLGYSQTSIKVDPDFWEKGLHPDDIGRVTGKLDAIFKEARVNKWEEEYRFRTQSGEYRYFYDRAYIIYENGKAVRMIGTMEDITARVTLEKKLELETLLKQKQIAEAVVTAQEKERTEIGKELHDNVNQLLSASKLYIDAAANDISNNEILLGQASGYIKNAIEEIRSLSKVLHAPLIYELGLCESINNLTDDIMMVNQLHINISYKDFSEDRLHENFKLTIYRIIQEQFTNILKHSRATRANILLSTNENDIYLEVTDNGIGFDTSKKRQGIGLSNILSRVSMYEGKMEMFSEPGKGSRICISFPLTETSLDID